MHLVGFTTEIYYDARPCERQIYAFMCWFVLLAVCVCVCVRARAPVFVTFNIKDSEIFQWHEKDKTIYAAYN